jgi:tetratricopeptide (TPR) repeat protein
MIENKKADLPPGLQSLYQTREQNALSLIENNNYSTAEQEYRTLLSEILTAQGAATRYHKGGIYHQIGYCLFLQKKTEDALLYFEYAFIEDCISGFEATQLPAYYNLYNVYRISSKQLVDLLSKIKYDINSSIPLKAEIYLKNYLDSGGKLDSLTVSKSSNVFVGGNYKNIGLLRYIVDRVRECGFSSIMAIDFEVTSEEDIYAHAMALLQDCGSAIFEITFDSGHLMEIERAINSKFFPKENILLLFQKRKNTRDHYISKMLLGLQVKPVGYMRIEEIPDLVKKFLGPIRRDI